MAEIKENIASNISALRKNSGMSQAELAEKLHYSDKAISKWERAESTPDVDALYQISLIFDVSIQYLFEEHDEQVFQAIKKEKINEKNKSIAFLSLLITGIWTICIVCFVFGYTAPNVPNKDTYFLALIWAMPLSFLVALIFGVKKQFVLWTTIFASIFLWTLLLALYLTVLMFYANVWYMFFIGLPLQAALLIWYFLLK